MFGNPAVNRLYLHSALLAVAENGGGIFIFVFLLDSGVPLPLTLCALAATTLSRYFMRPGVVPLARHIGLRKTLVIGVVIEAIAYLTLSRVHGLGAWLAIYIALGALGSTLYWTCYHAYFAALGDSEQRGSQEGTKQAINGLVAIAAPVLGGTLLAKGGPMVAFGAITVVQLLAAVPLVGARNVAVPKDATIDRKTRRFAARVMFADSFFGACTNYVWQIALFVTLGEHFDSYGKAMALAALFGAVATIATGRLIDLGHGKRILKIAYGLAALVLIVKASAFGTPLRAVVANAFGALLGPLLLPALMTPIYNMAKASSCPLRFHTITEGGWDLGCAAACLIAAGMLAAGLGFSLPILMGCAGLGAAYSFLRPRYEPGRVTESRSR